MRALGIILARGGSKGVPRKNIKKLLGKPLMVYTIEAARKAKSLNNIVLSTEDTEIAEVGCKYGVEVICRPAEYATDKAPMHLAVRHAVQTVEQKIGKVEIVVPLYANIPVRKKGIIDLVVEKLIATGADSVQSYTIYRKPPQWACRIDGDKFYPMKWCSGPTYRRQDFVPAYYPDGAAMALRRDVLMQSAEAPEESDAFLGIDRRGVIQEFIDTVDVDEPFDLLWAEFLLKTGGL